jgi:hypothetical protein
MAIHALDTAKGPAILSVRAVLKKLRQLIARTHCQLLANEATERMLLELDCLDEFRLADLGLVRHEKHVGWQSTVRGAEPVPVIRRRYGPLASRSNVNSAD